MRFGLNAYTVRFREFRTKEWKVFALDGDFDAWTLVLEYLMDAKNRGLVRLAEIAPSEGARKKEKRIFRIKTLKPDKPSRAISGLIESGEHGTESPIVNIQTEQTTHSKLTNEADLQPFYFRFHLPDDYDCGILLAQKNSARSIKGALEKDLKRELAKEDIFVQISTLTNKEILRDYLTGGTVTDVEVVAHGGHSESRELLSESRIGRRMPRAGTKISVHLQDRRGFAGFPSRVMSAVFGNGNTSELVEVYGLPEPEDVFVSIVNQDKARKFNITRPDDAGMAYDITDEVQIGHDGFPTLASLENYAADLAAELEEKLLTSMV